MRNATKGEDGTRRGAPLLGESSSPKGDAERTYTMLVSGDQMEVLGGSVQSLLDENNLLTLLKRNLYAYIYFLF